MCVVLDGGVVSQATRKVNTTRRRPRSERREGVEQKPCVCEVGEEGVGVVWEEVGGRVAAAGGDGDGARAEVAGAGDVVGRVADDDELFGFEVNPEVPADALA